MKAIGTWQLPSYRIPSVLDFALVEADVDTIDCAPIYQNQSAIGDHLLSLKRVRPRSTYKLTSKIWNDSKHSNAEVIESVDQSLRELQTDYLDICFIHWPFSWRKGTSFPASPADMDKDWLGNNLIAYEALLKCVEAGKIRLIGLSNFGLRSMLTLLDSVDKQPDFVQIELHPFNQQRLFVDYCNANAINIMAYSPFGSGTLGLLQSSIIVDIAARYSVPASSILLQWSLQSGFIPIPRSVDPLHLKQNIKPFRCTLDDAQLASIGRLDSGLRAFDGSEWCRLLGISTKEFWL